MADNTDDKKVVEHDGEGNAEEDKKPPVRLTGAALRVHDKKIADEARAEAKKDDDDAELTPKARQLIAEEVARSSKPMVDDFEVRSYIAEHPEHRKYEKAIRDRVNAWGDKIPVSEIAKTIVPPEATKEEKEAAKEKAEGKALGGSSARAREPKLPSTDAEFKEIYKQVKEERKTIKLQEAE